MKKITVIFSIACIVYCMIFSSNVFAEQKWGDITGNDVVDINDVVYLLAWTKLPAFQRNNTEKIKEKGITLFSEVQGEIDNIPGNDCIGDYTANNVVDINDVVYLLAWTKLPAFQRNNTEKIKEKGITLFSEVQGEIVKIPNTDYSCGEQSTDTETTTGDDTGTETAEDTGTGTATEGLGCEVPASVEIATDKTVSFNPPYPGAKWQSSVSNLDLTDSVLSWDAAVATDSEATIKYSVFECNTSGGSFVATDSMTLTETTMSSAYESKAYMVLSYQVVDTIETADEESGRCVEIATDDKRCYSDPEYYNN